MHEGVTIRRAEGRDARGIVTVLRDTWLATYPNAELGITKEAIEKSYEDSFTDEALSGLARKISSVPSSEHRFVAEHAGNIVGLATVRADEGRNELRTLYVLPAWQQKGVGTGLWEEARRRLDPHMDTVVWVAAYNTGAIAFYETLGFSMTGRRSERPISRRMESIGMFVPGVEMLLPKA